MHFFPSEKFCYGKTWKDLQLLWDFIHQSSWSTQYFSKWMNKWHNSSLQRVWHASRERLPFRTPGSVPHCGTCLCSNCWDHIPRTCHVFTRLFTSNTPWYFLDFAPWRLKCYCRFVKIKIILKLLKYCQNDTKNGVEGIKALDDNFCRTAYKTSNCS